MERRKKPVFTRTDFHKKPRFRISRKLKWRRARGRHSKLRQKRKGHVKMPSIGFGMPREIRGLVGGMKPRMIMSVGDLNSMGKDEIAVVSSSLGSKKKMVLAEKALKMNIKFQNFNPQKFLDGMKKMAEDKKSSKAKAGEKKEPEKKETAKKEDKE